MRECSMKLMRHANAQKQADDDDAAAMLAHVRRAPRRSPEIGNKEWSLEPGKRKY
jgi:hypothetical protein